MVNTQRNMPLKIQYLSQYHLSITADLLYDSNGNYHYPGYGHVPDGIPVQFTTTLGSINSSVLTVNGVATANLISGTSGIADVSATVDSQTVHTSVNIILTVDASPIGGLYNNTKTVTLTMNEPGTIYYTTDGTTPTTTSNIYTEPITINTNTILKYLAIDLAGNQSPIYTQTYTIDTIPPTVDPNPIGGLYNTTKTVTLTINEPGTIYYTTDGTTPTTTSNIYTNPITINTNTILKYFAIDLAGNNPQYTHKHTQSTQYHQQSILIQ